MVEFYVQSKEIWDLLAPLVTGIFSILAFVWGRRAARAAKLADEHAKERERVAREMAAQPVEIMMTCQGGMAYHFDPAVVVRRDEVSRVEILGRAGQAVGGMKANIDLPAADPVLVDLVKAGELSTVVLCFSEQRDFDRAVNAAEIRAGRRAPLPASPKPPQPSTVEQVAELIARQESLSQAINSQVSLIHRRLNNMASLHKLDNAEQKLDVIGRSVLELLREWRETSPAAERLASEYAAVSVARRDTLANGSHIAANGMECGPLEDDSGELTDDEPDDSGLEPDDKAELKAQEEESYW